MPRASHSVEIDAPPAQVMAALTDFASYPSFLPELEAAEVLRQSADGWEVRFRLQLIRDLGYTLQLTRSGERLLRWTLLEGVFKSNEGGWTLTPLDGGARTLARYEIDVSVGIFVPGNIVRSLVDRTLPDTPRPLQGRDRAARRGLSLRPTWRSGPGAARRRGVRGGSAPAGGGWSAAARSAPRGWRRPARAAPPQGSCCRPAGCRPPA